MSAHDALARLRCNRCGRLDRQSRIGKDGSEHLLSRHQARYLVDRPDHPNDAPRDYAVDDERPQLEARPMFGLCEVILLGSLAVIGLMLLWFCFGG